MTQIIPTLWWRKTQYEVPRPDGQGIWLLIHREAFGDVPEEFKPWIIQFTVTVSTKIGKHQVNATIAIPGETLEEVVGNIPATEAEHLPKVTEQIRTAVIRQSIASGVISGEGGIRGNGRGLRRLYE